MAVDDPVEHWDDWNSGGGPRYPNEKVVQFVFRRFPKGKNRENKRILDLGCGSGVNTAFLAAEGFDVHGIDISLVGVENTRAWLERMGNCATLSVGSVEATGYPDASFDALICVGVLECLDRNGFSQAMAEIVRLLRPGAPALLLFASETDFRIVDQKVPSLRGVVYDEVADALAPLKGSLSQIWIDRYVTTYENQRIQQDEHLITLIKNET